MPEVSDEARPDWLVRISIAVAGILGAGGIAAAAAGSHAGDAALLGPLSLIALTQAPAVLVLALLTRPRPLLKVGGLVIGAGALLFRPTSRRVISSVRGSSRCRRRSAAR